MVIFILIVLISAAALYLFLQQPQFGRPPSGERLNRILQSTNYKNGQFQNVHNTPALTEGARYSSLIFQFFFGKDKRSAPGSVLPSRKIDLLALDPAEEALVWFGHSSYYLQSGGKRFLVDPVFSGSASPVKFTTRSFKGSDVYTVADLPPIDYLLITHDHYDHLDYETVVKLKPTVSKVITGLGVGAHLEHWGYEKSAIIEKDWNETVLLEDGFTVNTTTARHFSGRKFKRNNTLWMSFVLTTPTRRIFIGGDSGYDTHFAAIGSQYGPFDLVILEDGQYNLNWKYIHMLPEEVVQAARDLKARKLLPVHWGKFSLALHAWNEPVIRVTREAAVKAMPVVHPMIGEPLSLNGTGATAPWWERPELA